MEQLFTRNENENNEIVSKLFIGIFIFVLLVWTICWCGMFDFDIQVASIFLCISAIFFNALCFHLRISFKFQRHEIYIDS